MPSSTVYIIQNWDEIQASKVSPTIIGVSDSCIAGESSNIDYILSDDVFFRGLEFLSSEAALGDTATLQIIDTDGITGVESGTVIDTPIIDWNIFPNSQNLHYTTVVPKKLLSSFTIRLIYTSVGESTVNVGINYLFLKALL